VQNTYNPGLGHPHLIRAQAGKKNGFYANLADTGTLPVFLKRFEVMDDLVHILSITFPLTVILSTVICNILLVISRLR